VKEPDNFISNNPNEREAVQVLNELFLEAALTRSADIHFQEDTKGVRVRRRAPGGALMEIGQYPSYYAGIFDQKVRSRSRLSLSDHHTPLDGRMGLRFPEKGKVIDIRVSIVPTVDGQSVVCRLLDQANVSMDLTELALPPAVDEAMRVILQEPHGLFVVTGPTGSGKTTTLYALVNEINDHSLNIITIENPVEYRLAGLNQINIDPIHMPYPAALRAVLRQDPDVIMIGEIRDAETARIAVEAANTGHLVIASMHANNAAMGCTRLIELGVDPGTLAASLRGITAQRLVRRIDPELKPSWGSANEIELEWMRIHGLPFDGESFPRVPNALSYKGNVPLVEMIVGDEGVRRVISRGGSPEEIVAAASRQPQFELLAFEAASKATRGLTTLDEARRVTSSADALKLEYKRLGYALIESGVATSSEIEQAISRQTEYKRNGVLRPIGRVLIEMGVCSEIEIRQALGQDEKLEELQIESSPISV